MPVSASEFSVIVVFYPDDGCFPISSVCGLRFTTIVMEKFVFDRGDVGRLLTET